MGRTFITGSDVQPFARISRRPIELLESISSVDLAMSQPFLQITQVDPVTKRPLSGRPITLDLVEPPRFGTAVGSFIERPLVSLKQASISTEQNYGEMFFNNVQLQFTVHRPEVVFNESSWRSLLQEGTSHVLEYGWIGSSKNDLINGVGYHDTDAHGSGLVVPSTKKLLINVVRYTFSIKENGELDFTVFAIENGEMGLRGAKLGDNSLLSPRGQGLTPQRPLPSAELDQQLSKNLMALLDGLPTIDRGKYGKFYLLGDLLNSVVAPLVENAAIGFGYDDVKLYLGNFNPHAPPTVPGFGGVELGSKSIGQFMVPVKLLKERLGNLKRTGQSILLFNFISDIVSITSAQPWSFVPGRKVVNPLVFVKTSTVTERNGGVTFVFQMLDRYDGIPFFDSLDKLRPDEQSQERLLAKVHEKGMPIIRFGQGFSYIKGSTFEVVTEPLIQSITIEKAFSSRKERVEKTSRPDPAGRAGQSRPGQFVPVGIIQGEIQMLGNFVFENFATCWIDFFGVRQISGQFKVRNITDVVGPGSFVRTVSFITEGTDPFNTHAQDDSAKFTGNIALASSNVRIGG